VTFPYRIDWWNVNSFRSIVKSLFGTIVIREIFWCELVRAVLVALSHISCHDADIALQSAFFFYLSYLGASCKQNHT